MRTLFAPLVLIGLTAFARQVQESGFSMAVPDDWRVQKYEQGYVLASSADSSRFVFVRPILGRSAGCDAMLRNAFAASWAVFPGARGLEVSAVPGNRSIHVARFVFGDGRRRGEVLCAETSPRTGMYYGLAAPVQTFPGEAPALVNILRTFRYGGAAAAPTGSSGALPRMSPWVEPNERAYTLQVPEGWRVAGGITRIDVTHARSGVELSSPDGASLARFGDPRLPQCTIPGPGMASMPAAQSSMVLCPYQTGRQAGESYLRQTLIREWGLDRFQVIAVQDRPDLSAAADQGPAQFGLRVRNAYAEFRFQASRKGQPVEGRLLVNTQMLGAVPGQNFMLGTYTTEVQGFVGPPSNVAQITAIAGHMVATTRWNIDWWQREQRIARDLAERTLAMMRAQGENQQKAFWDRMDASDRRREGVNDILGGTVRLSDGQGNTYQAQAGSNYYFFDTNEGRRASNPNDAVVGGDLYPSPLVDLRPLEVIR